MEKDKNSIFGSIGMQNKFQDVEMNVESTHLKEFNEHSENAVHKQSSGDSKDEILDESQPGQGRRGHLKRKA